VTSNKSAAAGGPMTSKDDQHSNIISNISPILAEKKISPSVRFDRYKYQSLYIENQSIIDSSYNYRSSMTDLNEFHQENRNRFLSILERDQDEKLGLGLSIEDFDTRDQSISIDQSAMFVIVKIVDRESPARRAKPEIRVGDRFLSLNGIDLTRLDRSQSLELFRNAPKINMIVVERLEINLENSG